MNLVASMGGRSSDGMSVCKCGVGGCSSRAGRILLIVLRLKGEKFGRGC